MTDGLKVGRKRPHLQSGGHVPLLDGAGTSENGPLASMIAPKVKMPIQDGGRCMPMGTDGGAAASRDTMAVMM